MAAIDFIKNLVAKPEMGKIYKGKVVKVIEADGPGPMSIIKLRNGKGKIKQVMTKHLSKVKK